MANSIKIDVLVDGKSTGISAEYCSKESIPKNLIPYVIKSLGLDLFNQSLDFFFSISEDEGKQPFLKILAEEGQEHAHNNPVSND